MCFYNFYRDKIDTFLKIDLSLITMSYFENLSDVSRTQVLAKGINLKNIIKADFLEELKDKFSDLYEDIVVGDMTFILIPKSRDNSDMSKDGIVIQLGALEFIKFEQPSLEHYKNDIAVITSNKKDNLDKVLA